MLGFDDQTEFKRSLFEAERKTSRIAFAPALAGAGAVVGLVMFAVSGTSPRSSSAPTVALSAGWWGAWGAASAEPDPCPTKPFGQCAGMNFSKTKAEKDLYNFTAGAASLYCCPAGTSCVEMGPVWGMCMPSWLPAASGADTTALLAEPAAEKQSAVATVKSEPPADPCPTKPFGQCAGMNFTKTKAELDLYNFTAGAASLYCCPAGTDCVTFGPVWGMCMPSFGGFGPGGGATALLAEPAAEKQSAVATVKSEAPADPCPTKPFGQCSGMNFTKTKAELDLYNFTAGAASLYCCPAGTSCVSFGPVWGMCMPSFGGFGPGASSLAQ